MYVLFASILRASSKYTRTISDKNVLKLISDREHLSRGFLFFLVFLVHIKQALFNITLICPEFAAHLSKDCILSD